MDISFSAQDRVFQQEVRAWLDEAWPQEMREKQARSAMSRLSKDDHVQWQKRLAEKGWAATNWPQEHGGAGFTATQSYIFDLERARVGAPGVIPFGMAMVAPVIMRFGTEEQKQRFLPDILDTNVWWCQGYSEPGSGSDLASLNTRAEDKGDHFLVNGVKTWTTMAQYADWIFCLVRTSNEDIRQLGISFLLIDMATPGIIVKPIVTLDQPSEDHQEINTVYFEDVVVPKENLIGEQGKGWTCAKYLLEFERGNAYSPALKQALAHIREMAANERSGSGEVYRQDAGFQARIHDIEIQVLAMEFTELRILGALSAGQNVGPESSMLKTRGTELQQAVTELAMDVCGHYALPLDQSSPEPGDNFQPVGPAHANGATQDYFNTRKVSIYAGSNEIQRNIMSKLVLGL
ncbi:MAG: acyl-CoA dehydrogenase family protein [Pseudomonadales bacterium]|jgi:alkylation response protein AidB-like acyl-CoA dehydrogenase|nr:acyl-CoA dehydrogenase family protein [Pseudomonadales bacterium]MDP6472999.1 acyl-CoA dehydrogenase family protein [Pseudomonadales bacterium]MDP6826244.1 acyl-CoA dehydrogenase family protein [Pseudomonadales bacterium]MDP6971930.1 acyl-CoA dehydrogenase family protein [Pseudomonadales bacterium]|tara:strand:- start:568 stop:1782 length:1215 start_codon:yes stop_codon:yes gene_type:complete